MRRRLFTILSALSLILCVATGALWLRSYWQIYALVEVNELHTHQWVIASVKGVFVFVDVANSEFPEFDGPGFRSYPSDVSGPIHWKYLGFDFQRPQSTTESVCRLFIPHWFVCCLGLTPPMILFLKRRSSLRGIRAGLCTVCGYNLRATPTLHFIIPLLRVVQLRQLRMLGRYWDSLGAV